MKISPLCPVLSLAAAPAFVFAAAWPATKEDLSAVAMKPDSASVARFDAASDVAFDKKAFGEAVALHRLARLVDFMGRFPLPEDLRAWLMANREPAEEFVSVLSPSDDPAAVAKLLGELWKSDTAGFKASPRLAMAIALVYDAPPPSNFPHGQVSIADLPRKLNDPVKVFAFFRQSAEANRLAQSPDKLGIDELALVVGFVTPLSEMREIQKLRINRGDMAKLYFSINYDKGRFARREYAWKGGAYSLESIRAKGGICVDQAYYTSATAQAFGVPAFILSGVGADGYHAFVGYLERPGKWKTDVGRYPEQKFATGEGINPLTWGPFSDHDLTFLQDRSQTSIGYATSELATGKALLALEKKDVASAARLLAQARSSEPLNPAVWVGLAQLAELRGDSPEQLVRLYSDAAKAMGKFRDIEVEWRYKLAALHDKMGKADAAFEERDAIVKRNVRTRPDLAVVLASQMMDSVMKAGDEKKSMSVFNRLMGRFEDAGLEFCMHLAYPYQTHLLKAGLKKEAVQVARNITQRFRADAGGQLADIQRELTAWAASGAVGESKYYRPRPEVTTR